MDSRQLLVVFATAIAAVCVTLVALTAIARMARIRRDRWTQRLSAPQRRNVLEVASGEDDDNVAAGALHLLTGREWIATRAVVVGMLGKVRGAPAQSLVDIVAAHGEIVAAREALRSRNAATRGQAVHLLGLARDAEAVDGLIRLTRDRSPEVRQAAVSSLGQIGSGGAAAAILNSVIGAGEAPAVPAWVAAEALLALGPGVEPIVRTGLTHDDHRIRGVALTVASHSVMPTTVPILRDRFGAERDPLLHAEVASALGRVGSAADVQLLVTGTAQGQPAALRLACTAALGELGHPDGLGRLADLTADPDRRLAQLAADMLLEAGAPGQRLLEDAARAQGHAATGAVAVALTVGWLREGNLLPASSAAARGVSS